MQKKVKVVTVVCAAVFGATLVVLPQQSGAQKSGKTQKTVNRENKQLQTKDEQKAQREADDARQAVAKSVAGSILFDAISAKESEWSLKNAYYGIKRRDGDSTLMNMSFNKGGEAVHITILEFDSTIDASSTYNTPRSYGRSENFDKYGNDGEKIFGDKNDFLLLNFRKGSFRVSITTKDEKTAERFAAYVAESISGFTQK